MKRIHFFVFLALLFSPITSYAGYFEWNGVSEKFSQGATNQVSYIDFGNVGLWGYMEISLSGTWDVENSTGVYTKRYQIGRNAAGVIYSQSSEVPASLGYVSSQWKLGGFEIDQNGHIKVPIYHLTATQNPIAVHISGVSFASVDTSLIALTSPATVNNSEQKDYYSIQDKVSIGTSELKDGSQLTVAGKIDTRGIDVNGLISGNDDIISTNGSIKAFLSYSMTYNGGIVGTMSNNPFYIYTKSTPKVTIDTVGNMGVGTISPAYKLDVVGTIRAREIKVDLDGADFVFEKDYKLMPLNKLETFINDEKHLPEVPSAKEMKDYGTNLGDLNVKLLQKIEELTLYTIAQNKKIAELEKRDAKIKTLEDKIEKLEFVQNKYKANNIKL